MQAIIVTGGKQYKVAQGDTLFIEKLEAEAGAEITFDQVLAILNEDKATFGAPTASSSTTPRRVTASVRVTVSPTPRCRSAPSTPDL